MNTISIMDESRVKPMLKYIYIYIYIYIFVQTMIERKQTFIKFKKRGYAITVQKKKKNPC